MINAEKEQVNVRPSVRTVSTSVPKISNKFRTRCVRAFLDLIIMSILMKGPSHGYNIIARIHRHLLVLLSPGMIYPRLLSLEKEGLVEKKLSKNGRRKIYSLTSKGREKCKKMFFECKDIYRYLLSSYYIKEGVDRRFKPLNFEKSIFST